MAPDAPCRLPPCTSMPEVWRRVARSIPCAIPPLPWAANAGGILTVSQCADMHYLRPGAGERLYAEASCVSAGRSTCLYRVNVTDGEDRLVAVCMVTGFRKAPVNKA